MNRDPREVRRLVMEVMTRDNPAYQTSLGACPAGHPAACITSSDEGTAYCRWCDEVARLRADLAERDALLREALPFVRAINLAGTRFDLEGRIASAIIGPVESPDAAR